LSLRCSKVTKPFEGDIELIDEKLKGCDPVGCHGCFNVCPSKAWIIPRDKKIDVVRDFCTYCGACEKACHVKAICVKRTAAKHTEIKDTPWAKEWKDAIICLTTSERIRPDVSRTLKVEKSERKVEPPVAIPEVNGKLALVNVRISKLMPLLSSKQVRRAWEKKDAKVAAQEIRKRMIEQK